MGDRDALGAPNHLALTANPAFIDKAEQRLRAAAIEIRVTERVGQKTVYFEDPQRDHRALVPRDRGLRA